MTSKLKLVGAAFAAILVAGAALVSSASAYELHSGSGSGTTYLTAEQIGTAALEIPAGQIKCTTVKGNGTYAGTTSADSLVSNVTFTGCSAFGLTAHIDMMGCGFTITGSGVTTGVVHVVCPTTGGGVTDEMTVTPTQGGVPICFVELPEQTATFSIGNESLTSPDDIKNSLTSELTFRITPINGTEKCGAAGLYHSGKLTNNITVKAFSDATHLTQTTLTYN